MSNSSEYYNLLIDGIGYVNRIRTVTPRKGEGFLCCDISAIYGHRDAIEYRRFSVKVCGSDAQHLIRRCEKAEKEQRKILIGFRLGDLWVDQFTYSQGERAGKPGVDLKARLLFIRWINVDKDRVYTAEKPADETVEDDVPAEQIPELPSPRRQSRSTPAPQPAPAAQRTEDSALAASF